MASYEKPTTQSNNHFSVLWAALWEVRKPEYHNYGQNCQFLSKKYVTILGYVNSAGRLVRVKNTSNEFYRIRIPVEKQLTSFKYE